MQFVTIVLVKEIVGIGITDLMRFEHQALSSSEHSTSAPLWHGPPWTLALLLAFLTMLGPFATDAYLPAFAGISRSLSATPVEMQQTLSAYVFSYAFMNLFHGALSDSVGRRPVVLCGVAMFACASIGCALSQSITQLIAFRALQGFSSGAGIVVSRAIIRDVYSPADAQKVMSQVTIFFGVAPVIAPFIGGWLFVYLGWQSVFWFSTLVAVALWVFNYKQLPETLGPSHRQTFRPISLMHGYRQLASDPRFVLLALASGVPFNGMFLYLLSAPVFLGTLLGLSPTEFFWLFILAVLGMMGGSFASGRLGGRIAPGRQIRHGFLIMTIAAILNLSANLLLPVHVGWALFPIAVFSFGWALTAPAVTLLVLDLYPARRGMASSMQAAINAAANGLVAGVVSPLVMHSTALLALASLVLLSIGLVAWIILRLRWPDIDHRGASS